MIYLIVKMLVLLLIAAGIGAWLGWLLRAPATAPAWKRANAANAARVADLRTERDAAEAKVADAASTAVAKSADSIAALEADLAAEKARATTLETEAADLRSRLAACEAETESLKSMGDAAGAADIPVTADTADNTPAVAAVGLAQATTATASGEAETPEEDAARPQRWKSQPMAATTEANLRRRPQNRRHPPRPWHLALRTDRRLHARRSRLGR